MNINNKVEAWSKKLFKMAIDEVRSFFIVNKTNGVRFHPSVYFQKAVDSAHFPDYYSIITNPIDLHSMSRKINGYFGIGIDVAFQQILSDMDLMRDNAHTYNVGDANIEVRICADAIRDFFRYLIRSALKVVRDFGDDAFKGFIFMAPFLESFVEEEEHQLILDFLAISNYNMIGVLEKASLVKDVGIKNVTQDVRSRIQYLTVSSLIESHDVPDVPPPPEAVSAASRRTSAAGGGGGSKSTKATSKAKNSSARPSKASNAFDDDPWEQEEMDVGGNAFDDDDDDVYQPTTSSGRSNKRSRSEAYHLDPDAEEDPFEDFVPSKPKKARSSAASRQSSTAFDQDLYVAPIAAPFVPQQPTWVDAALTVLKIIIKHPYVDLTSKAGLVIADFFTPVIDQAPHLAEQYLQKIAEPMDLCQVEQMLLDQTLETPKDFAECCLLVFQNYVDFNSTSGAEEFESIREMVAKSAYMCRYVRWLCLEHLPVEDDSALVDVDNPDPTSEGEEKAEQEFGFLRLSQQKAARREREALIAESFIEEVNNPYTECRKLLKDFERTRTNEDRRQLHLFLVPVDTVAIVDYSVYVRHPMDLSTLKYKLDGTEPIDPVVKRLVNPSAARYVTYGQFLEDFRRIFSNAKKYNVIYKDTDDSGVSRSVYEAAIILADRLESLIPKFSLTLCDKIECTRLNKSKQMRELEEARRKKAEEEAEKQLIKARLIEEMRQKDEKFALDTDIERKAQQMQKEAAKEKEASEKAILERNLAAGQSDGEVSPNTQASDLSPNIHSPSLHGDGGLQERAVALAAAEVAGILPGAGGEDRVVYVAGCGPLGLVASKWETEARKKLASRKKALDLFAWESTLSVSATRAVPATGGAPPSAAVPAVKPAPATAPASIPAR